MANADDIRWQQRLENFSSALAQLSTVYNQPDYTDLERSGLVQTFEFSFALACNTFKDLLFYEGYDVKSPRAAIRQAFAAEYLDEEDCETLLDALDKRNLLSHTYRKALALEAEALIKTCYHPALGSGLITRGCACPQMGAIHKKRSSLLWKDWKTSFGPAWAFEKPCYNREIWFFCGCDLRFSSVSL